MKFWIDVYLLASKYIAESIDYYETCKILIHYPVQSFIVMKKNSYLQQNKKKLDQFYYTH